VVYFIALLVGLSVMLLVVAVAQLVPVRPRAVSRRLAELEHWGTGAPGAQATRGRTSAKAWMEGMVQRLGTRVQGSQAKSAVTVRQMLTHAGYRRPDAASLYWGARVLAAGTLGGGALVMVPVAGGGAGVAFLAAAWFGLLGWLVPMLHLRRRIAWRQSEIRRALPDALDLLVVCVEAGLGLNQALVRVAQEIKHVSAVVGDDLGMVTLEIRAGAARHDALRNLGDRTGVAEVRSLAAMLIQTDRFGTSVGQALRVHAETLRTQRRQRAEEAAAKTSVKLIFPLVLFIFPAIFVVVLGPAVIQVFQMFSEME